jgi:hypothetical protein
MYPVRSVGRGSRGQEPKAAGIEAPRMLPVVGPAIDDTAAQFFEQRRSDASLDFWHVLATRSAGTVGLWGGGAESLLDPVARDHLVGAQSIPSPADPDRSGESRRGGGCLGWRIKMAELG